MDRQLQDETLRLVGVVLCGGKSTRMGCDKAELPLASGKTFLQHARDRLIPLCESVVISVSNRRPDVLSLPSCEHHVIEDAQPSRGPISGILAGLQYASRCSFNACVFTPVDTPLLTIADLESLVTSFRSDRSTVVCGAVNSSSRYEPLIGVYPSSVRHPIRDSIAKKQYRLQSVLADLSARRCLLPERSLHNFNTPSDVEQLTVDP